MVAQGESSAIKRVEIVEWGGNCIIYHWEVSFKQLTTLEVGGKSGRSSTQVNKSPPIRPIFSFKIMLFL